LSALYKGDHDFLAGLLDPSARTALWNSAAQNYQHSRQAFTLIILRYYVEDSLVDTYYPKDPSTNAPRSPDTIDQISPEQRDTVLAAIAANSDEYYRHHGNEKGDDRNESMAHVYRCQARLKLLGR